MDYSLKVSEAVPRIGINVASLIEDGATLQMGIGAIHDQVLKNLDSHKELGIHGDAFWWRYSID